MTDTPWTPGPWIASTTLLGGGDVNRREVYGYERHRLNTGSAGKPPSECGVFQTRSICRLNEFMHDWTAEDEANLRLILAAPELYEALALLLRETELAGLADARDYGWPNAILATRAALAKVRGEKE